MQYLVIMRLSSTLSKEQMTALFKPEAAKAREMFSSGALRSIHLIQEPAGAALLFEADDRNQVEILLGQLPLIAARAATSEIFSLAPFTGWRLLFAQPSA